MKNKKKLTRNKIKYYVKELQKYCHKPSCKNYETCPETCENWCKEILDLDTAIAWHIQYIIKEHYLLGFQFKIGIMKFISEEFNYINRIAYTFFYKSTCNKYSKLRELINELREDMDYDKWIIDKQNKIREEKML